MRESERFIDGGRASCITAQVLLVCWLARRLQADSQSKEKAEETKCHSTEQAAGSR